MKTFEIQLLTYIDAESKEKAFKEFLKTHKCYTEDAINIRNIDSDNDATEWK